MKKTVLSTIMLAALSMPVFAVTLTQDQVPEPKRFSGQHYLLPQEVYDIKQADQNKVLLVDIRTPAELQFVGYAPVIDGNVPYLTYDYSGWDDKTKEYKRNFNSGFVNQVEDLIAKKGMTASKDMKIILMCRSGDRSARAAELMEKSGYTNVWSAIEGFEGDKSKEGKRTVNGWKNANLPWTYALDKSKAAFTD
ncbi:MAG: sulfurtransferase [Proteobacteria bacterium]|nr:sulfurtransferase [Pseudomonadota bacterium]